MLITYVCIGSIMLYLPQARHNKDVGEREGITPPIQNLGMSWRRVLVWILAALTPEKSRYPLECKLDQLKGRLYLHVLSKERSLSTGGNRIPDMRYRYLLFMTNLSRLTNSTEQSWEANSKLRQTRNSTPFMERKASFTCWQQPAKCPYPEPGESNLHPKRIPPGSILILPNHVHVSYHTMSATYLAHPIVLDFITLK
jgi:hypothetical protein